MRAYHEAAEEACNEYFVLAARLFACPPVSHVSVEDAAAVMDEAEASRLMDAAATRACDAHGHPLPCPRPSSVCAGLRGVPWWLTVDPPSNPEDARLHFNGAQALTELQCERLRFALEEIRCGLIPTETTAIEGGEAVPTPSSLALAMGAVRMNAVGICVASSRVEGGTASGLGLFDLIGRVNHSCMPNARLQSLRGETEAAGATLTAIRDIEVGEEVAIDYLAQFDGSMVQKRAHLMEQYRFSCNCKLCTGSAVCAA